MSSSAAPRASSPWAPIFAVPPIPKATGPVDLVLPPTEDRPHRYFVLPNGLEVIVVSDPKADKAAASMDVGVGHLSDPDNLPGCAHFCEHLMFLGTEKYPSENEYSAYLASHNGNSNAYTAMTSTNYYFDVGPDSLQGALERFSRFFIEPLFAADCTEREIKAVDSEHKKNLQNDIWRFYQLEKSLSKPGHPYGKFGTGSFATLWEKPKAEGRDPRAELIEWWRREYCARRMRLAVAGRDDLDTLEAWVREFFDRVPVRSDGRPPVGPQGVRIAFEDHPAADRAMVTFAKPVRDARGLEISFPFPDTEHLYQTKPSSFVAHYLGHEGKGSVLSYLKRKGWANTLRAGAHDDATGFSTMKITIELTPDGLEHWRDVALAVFNSIRVLTKEPPSEQVYNEIKRMSEISFRFAERGRTQDYAMMLAAWIGTPVPREKIISSKHLLESFDPAPISAVFDLLDPRKALIGVTSRELPQNVEGSFDKTEPIYGTEYTRRKLDAEFLRAATTGAPIPELFLPAPNLFIPERLDVEKTDVNEPAARPTLLQDTKISRLWHKKDDRFWLPKANVHVMLHSPLLDHTPRAAVLSRVFCDLFEDSITEDVYDASLAELGFSIWYRPDGISITARGFSDKLEMLTEQMLRKLVAHKVDRERFGKIVEQTKQHWRNFALEEPYHVAPYWTSYAITSRQWTQAEKLAEIEHITADDVDAHAREIFRRLHVETLVHGNTTAAGAKAMQATIDRVLQPLPLAPAERIGDRTLILPSAEHVWEIDVANAAEPNNCVDYQLQIGDGTDPALRARLALLAQIGKEPSYNVLRTQEQLGYVVFAMMAGSTARIGYRVIVQSERSPSHVENRIEAFLDTLPMLIEDMADDDFERHRQTLIDKKREKPKNLGEETQRFWGRINDRYYDFGRRETDARALASVTKAEVVDLARQHVISAAPARRKLSVHLKSQYKGVKFDPASAQVLVAGFTQHAVPVDQAALGKLMASSPDLDAVQFFAREAVQGAEISAEAREALETMIAGLKGKSSDEASVRESNVLIEDIHAFKAGLEESRAPWPLESLGHVAKL
ncbi:metalloprotease [Cryptotrichosporon argae]